MADGSNTTMADCCCVRLFYVYRGYLLLSFLLNLNRHPIQQPDCPIYSTRNGCRWNLAKPAKQKITASETKKTLTHTRALNKNLKTFRGICFRYLSWLFTQQEQSRGKKKQKFIPRKTHPAASYTPLQQYTAKRTPVRRQNVQKEGKHLAKMNL